MKRVTMFGQDFLEFRSIENGVEVTNVEIGKTVVFTRDDIPAAAALVFTFCGGSYAVYGALRGISWIALQLMLSAGGM